ncbi:MAG: leucine-rich repeat domain-containing protein [Bacteroidia bacterium]
MKFAFLFFAALLSIISAAQTTLFERVGLPGTAVYTDLKLALREPQSVHRLQLTGAVELKQQKRISTLTNLEALKLEQNGWSNLPAPFYTLSSLLYMRSEGNAFTGFSDSVPLPAGIRFAEFSGTAFDTLPSALCNLPGLSLLTISKNTDTLRLTKAAGTMPFLTEFNLMSLAVDSTIWNITTLPRLEKLTLYNCSLTSIDQRIAQLSTLREINLSGNKLQTFPRELTQFTQLKRLVLRDNQITKIDSRICFLTNLEYLDLRGNPMTQYEIECVKVLLPRCDILF